MSYGSCSCRHCCTLLSSPSQWISHLSSSTSLTSETLTKPEGGRLYRRSPRDGAGSPGGGFHGGALLALAGQGVGVWAMGSAMSITLLTDGVRGRRRHHQPCHGGGRCCRPWPAAAVMGDAAMLKPRTTGWAAIVALVAKLLPRWPTIAASVVADKVDRLDWMDFWRATTLMRRRGYRRLAIRGCFVQKLQDACRRHSTARCTCPKYTPFIQKTHAILAQYHALIYHILQMLKSLTQDNSKKLFIQSLSIRK